MQSRYWLVAAALAAFMPALWAPFYLDDFALLVDPWVTSASGAWRLWELTQTRPLSWLTFWANYQIGGEDPRGYHVVNWALHAVCVALVLRVLPQLIPAPAVAPAAVLFALHPIQTEAVTYVFARPTLLMTAFCLLALQAWSRGRHWQAVLWFVPALLSKEECVGFPVLLWLLGRRDGAVRRKQAAAVGMMLALSLAAGMRVVYAIAMRPGSGAGADAGLSPLAYLAMQGWAVVRYLRLLVLPFGFAPESPLELTSGLRAWAGWLLVAALALACRRHARAGQGVWLAGALALLAPSSSIFPAIDLSADRRVYLPLVALGAAVGIGIGRQGWRLAAPLALVLGALSFHQAHQWTNPQRFWEDAVRLAPGKVRPRIQLARTLPFAQALIVLDQAERIAPQDPAPVAEKGRIYLEQGDAARALEAFGRALALAPNDPRAMQNRGLALLQLGQWEAAVADFRRALDKDPCLFEARRNLAVAGVPSPPPANCRYTPQQERILAPAK